MVWQVKLVAVVSGHGSMGRKKIWGSSIVQLVTLIAIVRGFREFGAPGCLSFVQDCLHAQFYEDEPAATQPWHPGQSCLKSFMGKVHPSLPITGVTGICAAWSPFYTAAPLGRVVALPWSLHWGKHKSAEFSLGLPSSEQLTETTALTGQARLLFFLTLLLEVTHFFEGKP